jgi:tetratricopeptide (TPR) repeat protein
MKASATHIKRRLAGAVFAILSLATANSSFAVTDINQSYLKKDSSITLDSLHETTEIAETVWADLSTRFVQLYEQANYQAAYDVAYRAHQIAEQNFGTNNISTADSLLKLGIVSQNLGEVDAAEDYMLSSLAILGDQLSPDHPDLAVVLTNLGNIYFESGRLKKSEQFHRKALVIRKNAFGLSDPSIAQSTYNLAVLYEHDHEYGKASRFYSQAISLWTQTLGPDHPYVGTALSNLTNTYTAQLKYAEAAVIQHRTVAYNKSVFGTKHQEVASSLIDLGALYLEQGQFHPAANAYEEALNIAEHVLSSSDPQLAVLMYTLANAYHVQARVVMPDDTSAIANTATTSEIAATDGEHKTDSLFAQALPLYEKAAKILDTEQNKNQPVLKIVLSELVLLYKEIGDMDKANATESRLSLSH